MLELLMILIPAALMIGIVRLFISTGDEYYTPTPKKKLKD